MSPEDKKLQEKYAKDENEIKILSDPDEFKELSLYPHEFLCLICNSFDRQQALESLYKPDFELKKKYLKNHDFR